MTKQHEGPLKRVTLLQPGEKSEDIYDHWAEDYERDLVAEYGYVGPEIAADIFLRTCPDKDAVIMDFGCGTGLVGIELHNRGYRNIHGVDVAEGMLAQAERKQVYQRLALADLTQPLALEDARYDAGICVGIFGNGHVTPESVPEMLRTLKPGSPYVIYLNDLAYTGENYADQFRSLEEQGVWSIESTEASNYMSSLVRPGWAITAYRPK